MVRQAHDQAGAGGKHHTPCHGGIQQQGPPLLGHGRVIPQQHHPGADGQRQHPILKSTEAGQQSLGLTIQLAQERFRGNGLERVRWMGIKPPITDHQHIGTRLIRRPPVLLGWSQRQAPGLGQGISPRFRQNPSRSHQGWRGCRRTTARQQHGSRRPDHLEHLAPAQGTQPLSPDVHGLDVTGRLSSCSRACSQSSTRSAQEHPRSWASSKRAPAPTPSFT